MISKDWEESLRALAAVQGDARDALEEIGRLRAEVQRHHLNWWHLDKKYRALADENTALEEALDKAQEIVAECCDCLNRSRTWKPYQDKLRGSSAAERPVVNGLVAGSSPAPAAKGGAMSGDEEFYRECDELYAKDQRGEMGFADDPEDCLKAEIGKLRAEVARLKRNPFVSLSGEGEVVTLMRRDYKELCAQLNDADRTVYGLQQEVARLDALNGTLVARTRKMAELTDKIVCPPIIGPSEREAQLHKEIERLKEELEYATDVICGEFCQGDRHHSECPRHEEAESGED